MKGIHLSYVQLFFSFVVFFFFFSFNFLYTCRVYIQVDIEKYFSANIKSTNVECCLFRQCLNVILPLYLLS